MVIGEKEFVHSPIAKIPSGGYKTDQYSKSSIQYLEWVSRRDNIKIRQALNGGEIRLPGTRYRLDGYSNETNTAFEYQGCVYHGCPKCFPEDREETKHPMTQQSMSEIYGLTMKKKSYIESLGMKYVCMWEHEFRETYRNDPELRHYLQNLDITHRLDPRESFFGGRTNASQLYYRTKEDEKIEYVDFTSLYPWVNKTCQYPVGHPEVITSDFKDLDQYFEIAKSRILPPRGLYHPVLPYKSNGKLKFPLCQTCAKKESPSLYDRDLVYSGTSDSGTTGIPSPQNIRGIPLEGHHPIRCRDERRRTVRLLYQHIPEVQARGEWPSGLDQDLRRCQRVYRLVFRKRRGIP